MNILNEHFAHAEPLDHAQARFAQAFIPLEQYLGDLSEEPLRWIVEGLLPETYCVLLGGTSKAGKSCLVTALAHAVATGEPFLGYPTAQAPVLWCSYEESRTERRLALREFLDPQTEPAAIPPEPPIENRQAAIEYAPLFTTHERPLIDSPEGIGLLRDCLRVSGAKLVVFDPLYSAHSADSLTDASSARRVIQPLKDLCAETGAAAIIIHHFNKNVGAGLTRERFSDSAQLAAAVSMDILMEAQDQPDGTRLIRLVGTGRGAFANQTWIVRSDAVNRYELLECGTGLLVEAVQKEQFVVRFLAERAEQVGESESGETGATCEEIAKGTGLNLKTVQNMMGALVGKRQIAEGAKRGRAKSYVYLA